METLLSDVGRRLTSFEALRRPAHFVALGMKRVSSVHFYFCLSYTLGSPRGHMPTGEDDAWLTWRERKKQPQFTEMQILIKPLAHLA